MSKAKAEWKIYRTRFLVRATQLSQPLFFVDALGREHCGQIGDYLVETSDGMRRIAPRELFEDIYVPMGVTGENLPSWPRPELQMPDHTLRLVPRPERIS